MNTNENSDNLIDHCFESKKRKQVWIGYVIRDNILAIYLMLSDFMDFVGCFVDEIMYNRKYLFEINCKHLGNFSTKYDIVLYLLICSNKRKFVKLKYSLRIILFHNSKFVFFHVWHYIICVFLFGYYMFFCLM